MSKVRDSSSIVEMAERCARALNYMLEHDGFDNDLRKEALVIASRLYSADFYQIDDGIVNATDDLFKLQFVDKPTGGLTLDADTRLPSPICAFWAPGSKLQFERREEGHFLGEEDGIPFMYLATEAKGTIIVYLVSPYFAPMVQGSYAPLVEGGIYGPEDGRVGNRETRAMHTLTVAAMCSILNQPNFTKREPAGSRQERRAAQRSGGYATDAWHKVTWNIGEEVKAKLTRDEPVRCMPLHYTRGHWRKAEEGWKNTTQRKDGLWYQWIEGFWSGHPAFGIKKSYHAPKIGKSTF
jgi:hypothetical protein